MVCPLKQSLLNSPMRRGTTWWASVWLHRKTQAYTESSLYFYGPDSGSDLPFLCPLSPCTETGQGIVHALTDLSSPGMTSGNGNSASSITGTAPQNGENKPPQAIVKPQILTHVIEGFVIQEGAEPFPVRTTSFPLFFFFFKCILDVY